MRKHLDPGCSERAKTGYQAEIPEGNRLDRRKESRMFWNNTELSRGQKEPHNPNNPNNPSETCLVLRFLNNESIAFVGIVPAGGGGAG